MVLSLWGWAGCDSDSPAPDPSGAEQRTQNVIPGATPGPGGIQGGPTIGLDPTPTPTTSPGATPSPSATPNPNGPDEGSRVLYGGMYGVVAAQPLPNPATGARSCPATYTAKAVMDTLGVDHALVYCYKITTNPADKPAMVFGGFYGTVERQPVPNPFTGASNCPAGTTARQVLGTNNVDWPLVVCDAVYSANISVPFEFGGIAGFVAATATTMPTTLTTECEGGFSKHRVYGTYEKDYLLNFCSKAKTP